MQLLPLSSSLWKHLSAAHALQNCPRKREAMSRTQHLQMITEMQTIGPKSLNLNKSERTL